MRIAVLGATGMIGQHVAREALRSGHEVISISRRAAPAVADCKQGVEFRNADLGDVSGLRSALTGAEAVIHCAGYYPGRPRHLEQEIATAAEQSENFFAACKGLALSKIVYVGAAIVLPRRADGKPSDGQESYPNKPPGRNAYVQVKWLQDAMALRYAQKGWPVVVGIPSMTFGEFDPGNSTGRFILEMANGTLPGYVAGRRNIVYAGDAARGLVRAVADGVPGRRYLFTGENMTMGDLMKKIATVTHTTMPKEIPLQVARILAAWQKWKYRYGRGKVPLISDSAIAIMSAGQFLDGRVAEQELAYAPQVSVEEAIARTFQWFCGQGMIAGHTRNA